MPSNGSCFMVVWTIFKKPPGGDHGVMDAHNCWFILFGDV